MRRDSSGAADDGRPVTLSLVLPIYVPPGQEQVVHRCLDSLEQDADALCRVKRVVVLNGWCDDELRKRLRAFASICSILPEPIGFTKAFNCCLNLTDDNVLFLNSDTVVPKNFIEAMRDRAKKVHGVLCCRDQMLRLPRRMTHDRPWGTAFYLPRYVIEDVGLWDDRLLNWRYSDQDYWIRCRQCGYDLVTARDICVQHIRSHGHLHMMDNRPGYARIVKRERLEMIKRYGSCSYKYWIIKHASNQEASKHC